MRTGPVSIAILLATHNGERFLVELLNSLFAQSHADFVLHILDDGSTDSTSALARSYSEKYPERVSLLVPPSEHLGARGAFARLLETSTADYLMLCDQDDVWIPHKVEETLLRMRQAEQVHGANTPLMVHADLKVVDSHLERIAESFWAFQNIHPVGRESLNRLLLQNVVTGCTVMINRALRDIALPIPGRAIMHDWWLALVAAAFGRIEHLDEAMVLYRQHGANEIGARRWSDPKTLLAAAGDRVRMVESLRATQVQAQAFLEQFSERLTPLQQDLVATYASMSQVSKLHRLFNLLKYRYFKAGLLRNLGLFARI